ncbi:MAG: hypothetical protein ABTQ32_14620 [Myxococcaceae bacterium]
MRARLIGGAVVLLLVIGLWWSTAGEVDVPAPPPAEAVAPGAPERQPSAGRVLPPVFVAPIVRAEALPHERAPHQHHPSDVVAPVGDALAVGEADAATATPDDAGEVAEEPAKPVEASPREREDDARFQVRWGDEGLCGSKRRAAMRAERESLLASFPTRAFGEATIAFDPRLDARVVALVAERLIAARAATAAWIDWLPNVPPPATIVYFDTPQLQSVACVSAQTIGYFDGRLHISADPSLSEAMVGQTVIHEYVHFALNTLSIPKPMWLHEGLAMRVAEETWFQDTRLDFARWLREHRLPFDAMVYAFPHTADEKFALASYYQSARMVDFIQAQRGPNAVRELVRLLSTHAVTADDAFVRGAGLTPSSLEPYWKDFVQAR